MSLVAGMVVGADSIEDVNRLRHAGNAVVSCREPCSLDAGEFLRAFTHGHGQQVNAVLGQRLIRLTEQALLLPGADEVVFARPGLHPPAGDGYANRAPQSDEWQAQRLCIR